MRFVLVLLILVSHASGQPSGNFTSGSTGADGPLNYAANLGMVYFPPAGLGMRPSNIYNFTTITIGAGTTIRLSGWVLNGPVSWLASGDVNIGGNIDLSGQPGYSPGNATTRIPSEPGAGGYPGGVSQLGTGQNTTAGNGPGGGTLPGGGGSFAGSEYLIPLTGGSGGAGGGSGCGGGGSGGGALLIASSTQITIFQPPQTGPSSTPLLFLNGGNGGLCAGGGSGGAARFVANTFNGNGPAYYLGGGAGGAGGGKAGQGGVFRVEAYTINTFNGVACCQLDTGGTTVLSTPLKIVLPTGGSSALVVTSVNGQPINANPFAFPDATVATTSSVPVVISGSNIPPNTPGSLYIFSETTPDQVIPFTLTGTLASTTATVNVPFPAGGSRGFAKAAWVNP